MIEKISLHNFRNFKKKEFEFSEKTTVIVGPNAIGKTNILESVFLLSTGKSFRARLEEEMVGYEVDIARIKGITGTTSIKSTTGDDALVNSEQLTVNGGNSEDLPYTKHRSPTTDLEVILTRGQINIGTTHPQKTPRKKLLVNGISRRVLDFAGNLKVVLFGPWDLDLVTESPSIRRRFLDNVLSQVDREYRRASLSYDKGLRQRNRLLYRIREEGISRSSLIFWDQLLIKNGNYMSDKRQEFIEFVNKTPDPQGQDFNLEYDSSAISEGRLAQYKEEEVSAATTLVGPHRDDFIFNIRSTTGIKSTKSIISDDSIDKFSKRDLARYGSEGEPRKSRDLARFGSRGEQRMGVLWLKLAELSYITEVTEEKPTLLLDDIFSELDHEHRDVVMEISKGQQTIITTADEHFVTVIKEYKNKVISL